LASTVVRSAIGTRQEMNASALPSLLKSVLPFQCGSVEAETAVTA
jgi:hypothetical protein